MASAPPNFDFLNTFSISELISKSDWTGLTPIK